MNILYVFEKLNFQAVRDGVGIGTDGLKTSRKRTRSKSGVYKLALHCRCNAHFL